MRRVRRAWYGQPLAHAGAILLAALASIGGTLRLDASPRFDGAGYAMLARALQEGQGYREIAHPDRPPHTHFPPGYPAALALAWQLTGAESRAARESVAHLLSLGLTLVAVLAGWLWFRRMFGTRAALYLGLALAVNWRWAREGGAIRTEPLYLLLGGLAVLAVTSPGSRPGPAARGLGIGLLLGAGILTRHVGVTLAAAVALELALRRQRATLAVAVAVAALAVAPWVAWIRATGRSSQAALFVWADLPGRALSQALFYVRRLPDQITGPVVEVGTVFRPGWTVPMTVWALLATAVLVVGWARQLRAPRRRLAALLPLCALPLLVVWPFTEAGRFLVPLIPAILAGATEGIAALSRARPARRARRNAALAILLASLPYTVYSLQAARPDAERALHAEFDAACAWIAAQPDVPGPILGRYAAETYWLTGRWAVDPGPVDDPAALDRLLERFGVAFVLVEGPRYARAGADPLAGYAAQRSGRLRAVWQAPGGTMVYRITPGPPPGPDQVDEKRPPRVG